MKVYLLCNNTLQFDRAESVLVLDLFFFIMKVFQRSCWSVCLVFNRKTREWMTDAERESSILSKSVFSACGDKRQQRITSQRRTQRKACVVQQSLEAPCPYTKVWVGLHSLLCFGCIIIRVLWTSASLVRSHCLNKKKKKKALRREQKSSRSRLFSLETERVCVKPETCSGVCESVPASWADFCADVCQHTDTMSPCATERQRHIHPTDPGEDNKHRTADERRRYH